MAKDQLKDFHLFAMDSALPFSMGVINNVKAGGLKKVIDVFKSSDPFLEMQVDGETSAKIIRDKIDQFIPGLGNPVVSVDVIVEDNDQETEVNDRNALVSTLNRIDNQLDKLSHILSINIEQ